MATKPTRTEVDHNLADLILERDILTKADIYDAFEAQETMAKVGIEKPLADVLVDKKLLSRGAVDGLLAEVSPSSGRGLDLSGYEIIGKVGQGGMGSVFRARQVSMDRQVAVKVLAPRLARNERYIERFYREARSSARLNHPNIVQGIDVGRSGDYFYFVMEFVDGPTLKQVIERDGAIDEEKGVSILRQMLDALQHAHANGQIHRDVKPDNIMLDAEGTAKLCDLGLAKDVNKKDDASVTREGMTVGTPHYISPEQAQGSENVDIRTDLYSLGATLYHTLTGLTPFEGPGAVVMAKHLNDQCPSPWELNPKLSDGIVYIIEKMMAKKTEDRYAAPKEVLEDLDRLAGKKTTQAERFTNRKSTCQPLGRLSPQQKRELAGRASGTRYRSARTSADSIAAPAPPSGRAMGVAILAVLVVFLIIAALVAFVDLDEDAKGPEGGPDKKGLGRQTHRRAQGGQSPYEVIDANDPFKKRFEKALAFADKNKDNPEQRDEIYRRFEEIVRSGSPKHAVVKRAQKTLREMKSEFDSAKNEAMDEAKKKVEAAVARNDFSAAHKAFDEIPKRLRDVLYEGRIQSEKKRIDQRAVSAFDEIRKAADGMLKKNQYKQARFFVNQTRKWRVDAVTRKAKDAARKIDALEKKYLARQKKVKGRRQRDAQRKDRERFDQTIADAVALAVAPRRDLPGALGKVQPLLRDARYKAWVGQARRVEQNLRRFNALIGAAQANLPNLAGKTLKVEGREAQWKMQGEITWVRAGAFGLKRRGAEFSYTFDRLSIGDLLALATAGVTDRAALVQAHLRAAGAYLIEENYSGARMALMAVKRNARNNREHAALLDSVDKELAKSQEAGAAEMVPQVRRQLTRTKDKNALRQGLRALARLKTQYGQTGAYKKAADELQRLAGEADKILAPARKKDPRSTRSGAADQQAGKIRAAVRSVAGRYKITLKKKAMLYEVAEIEFALQDFKSAYNTLLKIRKNPASSQYAVDDGSVDWRMAQILQMFNQQKPATDAFKAALDKAQGWFKDEITQQGNALSKYAEGVARLKELREQRKKEPKNAGVQFEITQILDAQVPRYLDRRAELQVLVDRFAQHQEVVGGEAIWQLLDLMKTFGEWSEVVKRLNGFAEKHKDHWSVKDGEPFWLEATAQHMLGNFPAALKAYERLQKSFKSHWSQRKGNQELNQRIDAARKKRKL